MSNLSDRIKANMDTVLEETCHNFSNGGDHELRRYIAEQLQKSAEQEKATLIELRAVAQKALRQIMKERTRPMPGRVGLADRRTAVKRPWTDKDIKELKALVSRGVSANRASVVLHRSLIAVRRKALEHGMPFRSEWHQQRKGRQSE